MSVLSASINKYRALVVDDDASCRDSMATLLSLEGFATLPVGEAASACQIIRATKLLRNRSPILATNSGEDVHFLILDNNLPDFTGLDVLRTMRDLQFFLPSIVVTGEYSAELERAVLDLGGFAVVPKPVEPVSFRVIVRNLVSRL
ncbi:MAG: response regulator [Planctomycetota bacterium]